MYDPVMDWHPCRVVGCTLVLYPVMRGIDSMNPENLTRLEDGPECSHILPNSLQYM